MDDGTDQVSTSDGSAGTLRIAAAPIGRPDDASARLAAALGEARIIAAEDTRRVRRLAAALGVDRLTIADQKHTATVAVVDGALAGRGHDGVADSAAAFPGTDAMITNLPDVALTILVADCAPVVLYDPVRRAVGVAHSGRVGTLKGVIPQTIKAMGAAFGSAPADLLIGIGPAIGAASYEIGAAEAAEVMTAFGSAGTQLLVQNRPGHAIFDLPGAIRRQLRAGGVPGTSVFDMAIDTRTATDTFFSDRATRPCGRFAAIAVLRPRRNGLGPLSTFP